MTQQLATLKVAGAFEKSGEVMGLVNKLVRLPEVSATMMELSKEMVKVCHCIVMLCVMNGCFASVCIEWIGKRAHHCTP